MASSILSMEDKNPLYLFTYAPICVAYTETVIEFTFKCKCFDVLIVTFIAFITFITFIQIFKKTA